MFIPDRIEYFHPTAGQFTANLMSGNDLYRVDHNGIEIGELIQHPDDFWLASWIGRQATHAGVRLLQADQIAAMAASAIPRFKPHMALADLLQVMIGERPTIDPRRELRAEIEEHVRVAIEAADYSHRPRPSIRAVVLEAYRCFGAVPVVWEIESLVDKIDAEQRAVSA